MAGAVALAARRPSTPRGGRFFGGPRRATARLHPGRASFEASGAMLCIAPLAPQDDGADGVVVAYGFRRSPQFVGPSPRMANVVVFSLVMPNLSNSLS